MATANPSLDEMNRVEIENHKALLQKIAAYYSDKIARALANDYEVSLTNVSDKNVEISYQNYAEPNRRGFEFRINGKDKTASNYQLRQWMMLHASYGGKQQDIDYMFNRIVDYLNEVLDIETVVTK